jgi:hypothetical protein
MVSLSNILVKGVAGLLAPLANVSSAKVKVLGCAALAIAAAGVMVYSCCKKRAVVPLQRSKEEGERPALHDPLFNFIPGSCLETAASIALLKNPGKAGRQIDTASLKIADVLNFCYAQKNANAFIVDPKGNRIPLLKALDAAILHELRPTGNQLGRCLNYEGNDWFAGDGVRWLLQELEKPLKPGDHLLLLTKIRAISALGKFIYDNYAKNPELMAKITGQPQSALQKKYEALLRKVRNEGFSSAESRSRSERAPIIDGVSISRLDPQPVRLPGGRYGGSNGDIYVADSFDQRHRAVADKFDAMKRELSAEGIPRENQVIDDNQRPGILTEFSFKAMPKAFEKAGLKDLLKDNALPHGNGINRWMQQGSYIRQAMERDLPIAGAHSGSAADILFALDCLRDTTIFGDREYTESVGVLISAWMTFGGYHSFIETFPIAQAAAADQVFKSAVTTTRKKFYEAFLGAARRFTDAGIHLRPFIRAYNSSL